MVRHSQDGSTIIGNSWSELGISVREGIAEQKTFCPNCHASRKHKGDKSLSVNVSAGVANCHNCGIKYVLDRNGIGVEKLHVDKVYKIPNQTISYDIDPAVAKWFAEDRKISIETLKEARVTSGVTYMPQVLSEARTSNFNYFFRDILVNIKHRDGRKNFKFESGAQLIFYNMDCLLDPHTDYVIITEGEIDTLSYIESGKKSVISVPSGASKGSMNLYYLTENYNLFDNAWRLDNGLKPLTKIIISTDADEPGIALREELIKRLGSYRCYIANLKGYKDANELLIAEGKTSVFNSADMAKGVPIKDTTEAQELLESLMAVKNSGGFKPGNQIGSDEFKRLISFESSRLTTITGVPSHGKSVFLDDIMCRLAIEYDWVFAVFSPESFPIELHVSRLLSKIIGKNFNHLTDSEIRYGLEFINDHFIWIYPEDDNYRLRNILNITESIIKRYGANALIIDPWTEIDKEGNTGTEDINDYLTDLNKFKRTNKIHIFLVAHPTKMTKDPVTGKVTVPDLYNINGSSYFYNKTDMGMTVYRNFDTETVDIYVNKVKFEHLGKIGVCTLKYNVLNGRYQDMLSISRDGWDNSNWLNRPPEQSSFV